MSDELFSSNQVLRQFASAAQTYDSVALMQQQASDQILERLQLIKLHVNTILDLGSGTGLCLQQVASQYPDAKLIALDPVDAMLNQLQNKLPQAHCLIGDAQNIPLTRHSVDLVVSNMMLHWSLDIEQVFVEVNRVLRPGGLFVFSTLGPDTLTELRQSWLTVDDYNHVHHFYDMHDLGDALQRAGFADSVMDMNLLTLRYRTLAKLFEDFKLLGVRNVAEPRKRGLMTRRQYQAMCTAYEHYKLDDTYPATYELVFGVAWGQQQKQSVNTDGVIFVSLDSLKKHK